MKVERLIRVNELIRREIAANLHRFVHGADIDIGAVTITRVVATSNLRTARVWVSVLAGGENPHRVLELLLDRRTDIQAHLGRTLKLKYTPRLFFQTDDSLEQGDRVLALLSDLAEQTPGMDPDADPASSRSGETDDA